MSTLTRSLIAATQYEGNILQVSNQQMKDLEELKRGHIGDGSVTDLSSLSPVAGLLTEGEFRVGNGIEPGSGFTGARLLYPPVTISGTDYIFAALANDVLQVGISLTDGKLYAGGGKVVIDSDGVSVTANNGVQSNAQTIKHILGASVLSAYYDIYGSGLNQATVNSSSTATYPKSQMIVSSNSNSTSDDSKVDLQAVNVGGANPPTLEVRNNAGIKTVDVTNAGVNIGTAGVTSTPGNLALSGSIVASTPIGCSVYNSASQSIGNTTQTPITFDSENDDTDNMHYTSAAALTGTWAKTAGSPNLTGTGTLATSQLSVGQVFTIPGGGGTDRCVVITITDDTHIIVASQTQPAFTASGQTATRDNTAIVARTPGRYDLNFNLAFANDATNNIRQGSLRVNGTTYIGADSSRPISGFETVLSVSRANYNLNQWDFVQGMCFHDKGANLNVNRSADYSAVFSAHRVA